MLKELPQPRPWALLIYSKNMKAIARCLAGRRQRRHKAAGWAAEYHRIEGDRLVQLLIRLAILHELKPTP